MCMLDWCFGHLNHVGKAELLIYIFWFDIYDNINLFLSLYLYFECFRHVLENAMQFQM